MKHQKTPVLVAVTEKHAFKSSLTDEESPVNEDLTTSYHIHDLFPAYEEI